MAAQGATTAGSGATTAEKISAGAGNMGESCSKCHVQLHRHLRHTRTYHTPSPALTTSSPPPPPLPRYSLSLPRRPPLRCLLPAATSRFLLAAMREKQKSAAADAAVAALPLGSTPAAEAAAAAAAVAEVEAQRKADSAKRGEFFLVARPLSSSSPLRRL